jgi:GNAT superfamily N-acetyltransferase
MPSHLSSMGFQLESEADFVKLAEQAYEEGQAWEVDRGTYIKWAPGGGIELWLQLDAHGDIIGLNPHFRGKGLMRAALTHAIVRADGTLLDGAFHAWANPSEDDPARGDFPFVFDVPDFYLDKPKLPAVLDVQLAAFAHELQSYESDQAYDETQPGEIKFAAESFIPAGLFFPGGDEVDPPQAHALFSGHVQATALITNPITGQEFCWAQVRTLGGEMDVVADPVLLNGLLVEGGVVSGTFWLSGRFLHNNDSGA